MEMATFFNGHRMIPGGKSDLEIMELDYQKQIDNLKEENTELKETLEETLEKQDMENISEADIERITNILNNTGGIVKQDKLKQLTPAEQRLGVKM